MLKQHRIQPDFVNILQFYYYNNIKGKAKGMIFLFCFKSIKLYYKWELQNRLE